MDKTHHTLTGPHGPLLVRVYLPDDPTRNQGLVWMHGGAFAYGSLDQPEADFVARTLAHTGISVVSVRYQLAPQRAWVKLAPIVEPGVHFPVASDEVTAAFQWASKHADARVGTRSWALGGASAGANLAASATLRLRDSGQAGPNKLVLVYPLLHAELPTPGAELASTLSPLPASARLGAEVVAVINENYAGTAEEMLSAYAFPGGHDLSGLPATRILNSDYDGLRASGEAFATELRMANVDVEETFEPGTRHGHLNDPADPGAHRSLQRMIAWLADDNDDPFDSR